MNKVGHGRWWAGPGGLIAARPSVDGADKGVSDIGKPGSNGFGLGPCLCGRDPDLILFAIRNSLKNKKSPRSLWIMGFAEPLKILVKWRSLPLVFRH